MPDKSDPRPAAGDPTATLAAALRGLARSLSRQSARQADVVDAFAGAIRELAGQVQNAHGRIAALESRLERSDERSRRLERVVDALARQGWIQ